MRELWDTLGVVVVVIACMMLFGTVLWALTDLSYLVSVMIMTGICAVLAWFRGEW
jgi:preprotein translocase subunit SecE